MKRLALGVLLACSMVHVRAEDQEVSKLWRDIHNNRGTSALKAVICAVLGAYAGYIGFHKFCNFCTEVGEYRTKQWWPQTKNVAWEGVQAGGMTYTSILLFLKSFKYLQHATGK